MGPSLNKRIRQAGTPCARVGDTRRLMVAVLGVWAMVLQSMLPFAGALAAESDNGFWVALCNTAGIENIYLGDTTGDTEPGDANNSSGCDVCTVCACTSGTGCGCSSVKLVHQGVRHLAGSLLPANARVYSQSLIDPHHTRGPPV
jgi:DUF2946 family protein